MEVHNVLDVFLFQVRSSDFGPVGAISHAAHILRLIVYWWVAFFDVTVDVEGRVFLLLLLHVFVF